MSWGSSIDVRQVIFVNKLAEESYENLPEPVREAADNAIALIQNNRPLPPKRVDKLKGDLSGISEVRLPFDTNTYRVFHVLEHEEVVYIIDAGIKKSNKKSEMPQQLIDRLKERKKTVEEHYKKNYVELRSKFVERENRRSLNQQARRPKGV